MINFSTIIAIARRHLLAIVIITLLSVSLSIFRDLTRPKESSPVRYTAQTSVHYVVDSVPRNKRTDGSEATFIGRGMFYNVSRLVESNEVAGEVRRQFGEETTIQVAYYKNPVGNLIETDFVTLSVRAESAELALKAARLAAELTSKRMEELLRVEDVSISSPATLVNNADPSKVVDFGTAELKAKAPSISSGIDKRRLFIFSFLGLFGSFMLFAARDLLSRRLFDRYDVERLTHIPVLACITSKQEESYVSAVQICQFAVQRGGYHTAHLVSCVSQEKPQELKEKLSACGAASEYIVAAASLDNAAELLEMQQAEAVILLVRRACASGKELDEALARLELLNIPIVGCIFVDK